MIYYEVNYRDNAGHDLKVCVNAQNVSEAVYVALESDPVLRGNVSRIKSCIRFQK